MSPVPRIAAWLTTDDLHGSPHPSALALALALALAQVQVQVQVQVLVLVLVLVQAAVCFGALFRRPIRYRLRCSKPSFDHLTSRPRVRSL
jgi:hypothetical protein